MKLLAWHKDWKQGETVRLALLKETKSVYQSCIKKLKSIAHCGFMFPTGGASWAGVA